MIGNSGEAAVRDQLASGLRTKGPCLIEVDL
jgi:hypothetical protein